MRYLVLFSLIGLVGLNCLAQTSSPVLLSAGNVNPFPLAVAPGQVLTLFVQFGVLLPPVTTSTVSAVYLANEPPGQTMPVLQVVQVSPGCTFLSGPCPQVLAVTVQVPHGIPVYCPQCANPVSVSGVISISVNGEATPSITVKPLADQVHFLTACDVIVSGANSSLPYIGGLPCTPMIAHADGTLVSNIRPARAGEELAAYVTGLAKPIHRSPPASLRRKAAPPRRPSASILTIAPMRWPLSRAQSVLQPRFRCLPAPPKDLLASIRSISLCRRLRPESRRA